MKATLPEGAEKSGIKIVGILLLSSEFNSHVSSASLTSGMLNTFRPTLGP